MRKARNKTKRNENPAAPGPHCLRLAVSCWYLVPGKYRRFVLGAQEWCQWHARAVLFILRMKSLSQCAVFFVRSRWRAGFSVVCCFFVRKDEQSHEGVESSILAIACLVAIVLLCVRSKWDRATRATDGTTGFLVRKSPTRNSAFIRFPGNATSGSGIAEVIILYGVL